MNTTKIMTLDELRGTPLTEEKKQTVRTAAIFLESAELHVKMRKICQFIFEKETRTKSVTAGEKTHFFRRKQVPKKSHNLQANYI